MAETKLHPTSTPTQAEVSKDLAGFDWNAAEAQFGDVDHEAKALRELAAEKKADTVETATRALVEELESAKAELHRVSDRVARLEGLMTGQTDSRGRAMYRDPNTGRLVSKDEVYSKYAEEQFADTIAAGAAERALEVANRGAAAQPSASPLTRAEMRRQDPDVHFSKDTEGNKLIKDSEIEAKRKLTEIVDAVGSGKMSAEAAFAAIGKQGLSQESALEMMGQKENDPKASAALAAFESLSDKDKVAISRTLQSIDRKSFNYGDLITDVDPNDSSYNTRPIVGFTDEAMGILKGAFGDKVDISGLSFAELDELQGVARKAGRGLDTFDATTGGLAGDNLSRRQLRAKRRAEQARGSSGGNGGGWRRVFNRGGESGGNRRDKWKWGTALALLGSVALGGAGIGIANADSGDRDSSSASQGISESNPGGYIFSGWQQQEQRQTIAENKAEHERLVENFGTDHVKSGYMIKDANGNLIINPAKESMYSFGEALSSSSPEAAWSDMDAGLRHEPTVLGDAALALLTDNTMKEFGLNSLSRDDLGNVLEGDGSDVNLRLREKVYEAVQNEFANALEREIRHEAPGTRHAVNMQEINGKMELRYAAITDADGFDYLYIKTASGKEVKLRLECGGQCYTIEIPHDLKPIEAKVNVVPQDSPGSPTDIPKEYTPDTPDNPEDPDDPEKPVEPKTPAAKDPKLDGGQGAADGKGLGDDAGKTPTGELKGATEPSDTTPANVVEPATPSGSTGDTPAVERETTPNETLPTSDAEQTEPAGETPSSQTGNVVSGDADDNGFDR